MTHIQMHDDLCITNTILRIVQLEARTCKAYMPGFNLQSCPGFLHKLRWTDREDITNVNLAHDSTFKHQPIVCPLSEGSARRCNHILKQPGMTVIVVIILRNSCCTVLIHLIRDTGIKIRPINFWAVPRREKHVVSPMMVENCPGILELNVEQNVLESIADAIFKIMWRHLHLHIFHPEATPF